MATSWSLHQTAASSSPPSCGPPCATCLTSNMLRQQLTTHSLKISWNAFITASKTRSRSAAPKRTGHWTDLLPWVLLGLRSATRRKTTHLLRPCSAHHSFFLVNFWITLNFFHIHFLVNCPIPPADLQRPLRCSAAVPGPLHSADQRQDGQDVDTPVEALQQPHSPGLGATRPSPASGIFPQPGITAAYRVHFALHHTSHWSAAKGFFTPRLAVLRIHDILRWIRIWIRGSMPLTNGSGSCYFFVIDLPKLPTKN